MSSDPGVVDTVSPMNVADLSTVMKRGATDDVTVQIRGAGTKSDQVGWTDSVERVITTAGMNRIVEHAAGDLVVTAQAGVTLAALQAHVAPSGQWLALDPPEAGATVGGIVAAAASGPRRLLYGTPRDLLIGITFVLADGTIAKSGGRVVKNVAGYDLGRLFTGSCGTLGAIAECTFRLHPLPAARRVVTIVTSDPAAAVGAVLGCGAVPSAIEWDGRTLVVMIESIETACVAQADDVVAAVGGVVSTELPPGFGQRPTTPVLLKLTYRLGALRQVLDVIANVIPTATVSTHAASGVTWLGTDDLAQVEELRSAIATYDGGVVVTRAPSEQTVGVDVWGPARGLAVMRRIKNQFDPANRLSPGRFVGGI